ncbi:MAG: hypothetical protein LKE41_04830 [Prevotella sp.]|jgi:hypothetical protein|nr:hypothetical protein [Prevotella sp.]MCI2080777.1 hypothetical protein [Prevotella sp.]MCI2102698.1 hypothetical protein [Prevotella sp.]HCN52540.1 hypothetical protein [Prevotella sp.]
MKKNNLLASMAGKALALATAMMMSMAFTSCSDDNDTAPAAQTKPSVNTVTLDGVTSAVTTAEPLSYKWEHRYWRFFSF